MCSTSLKYARRGSSRNRSGARVAGAARLAGVVSLFALGAATLAGCKADSTVVRPFESLSPRQEAASKQAVTLRFREMTELAVRRLDSAGSPEPGVTVTFTLTGDSGGSALAGGSGVTDETGVARVVLTAGSDAAVFRVVAASDGAEPLIFDFTVSRAALVNVSVRLDYQGVNKEQVAQVRALLYADRSCAKLPIAQAEPEAWREQYVPVAGATIEFLEIPARTYAVVGRAEDLAGKPVARGCVDLLDAQLNGGRVELPMPLASVVPVLADAYLLDSSLDLSGIPSPVAPWDRLTACPIGFSQSLLDAMVGSLDGPAAAALEGARRPADKDGCRTELDDQGAPTLDGKLHQLLWRQGGPLAQIPSVAKDLQAIVSGVRIGSRLALTPRNSAHYYASHALTQLAFHDAAGHSVEYDPARLGLPVTSLDAITADFDGNTLYIQPHGLTLRLPWLWGHALADLALAPRMLPADVGQLVDAVVGAAVVQNGNVAVVGCAAVELTLCAALGNGPCSLEPACRAGQAAFTSTLTAPFAPPAGVDLTLGGRAAAIDADGDLVVEALAHGELDVVLGLTPGVVVTVPGQFTGEAAPIP